VGTQLGASSVGPHGVVEASRFDIHPLGHTLEEGGGLVLAGVGDPVVDEAHEPRVGFDVVNFAEHA